MTYLCASCVDHPAQSMRMFKKRMRPFCERCLSMLDRGHTPSSGSVPLFKHPNIHVRF